MALTPHSSTDAAAKPYASPTLTSLGSISSVTAGDDTGSLDCLVGDTPGGPGFQPTPADCTS